MAADGLCDSTPWLFTSSPLTCFSDDYDAKQPIKHNTCRTARRRHTTPFHPLTSLGIPLAPFPGIRNSYAIVIYAQHLMRVQYMFLKGEYGLSYCWQYLYQNDQSPDDPYPREQLLHNLQ